MPISKNGKLQYTQDQFNVARFESSTLEYVKSMGYPLVKKGSYYASKEHDSLVFAPNGMWFWNSRQMKGGAIEFLTEVEHKTFAEAVLILAGERVHEQINQSNKTIDNAQAPFAPKESDTEKPEFILPEKAKNQKRLFGYLCNGRHLDGDIVGELLDSKRVYGSVHKGVNSKGEPYESYNIVFVGYDKDGNARSAFRRGASSFGAAFKRDVTGSEKCYPFCVPGYDDATEVAVFEASIDAISHATLVKNAEEDYKLMHRIALGGTDGGPLFQFLKDNPQIKKVCLCLDNDDAGIRGNKDLFKKLSQEGYTSENGYEIWTLSPRAKDFNEDLKNYEMTQQDKVISKPKVYPENLIPKIEQSEQQGCDGEDFERG